MGSRCTVLERLGEGWASAWLDGQLPRRHAEVVRAHLGACDACAADVRALERTRALVRSLPARRLPDALWLSVPVAAAVEPPPPQRLRVGAHLGAVAAVVLGFVGGAAFALGDEPAPAERVVQVPVDVFVADHLVRSVGEAVSTPVLMGGSP